MKKIDIVQMNSLLQQAGRLKIKDNKIGYSLFKVSKRLNDLVQGYAEYIQSIDTDKQKEAEQELLMQEEVLDDYQIEGLEEALINSEVELDYILLGNLIEVFNK